MSTVDNNNNQNIKKQRLELTWIGKEEQVKLEPRILIEDCEKSYGDKNTENMLIHGDNLLALKALEQDFAGKVKCIYIDPPYNTGSAFEHYEDNLEHSIWLSLMKPRLSILRTLLTEDGYIFIQIDDNEQAYLKVLCDEIFGRNNYVNTISVNTKVSAGASGGGEDKRLKKNIEYILVYSKNYLTANPFYSIYKETELMTYINNMKNEGKSYKYTSILYKMDNIKHYKTIHDGSGDDIDIYSVGDFEIKSVKQVAELENTTEEDIYNKYYDKVMTTTNAQTSIRTRVWEATDNKDNMYLASYVPKSGRNKGQKTELLFKGKQKVLVIWLKDTADIKRGKIYKKERIGTYWDGFSWINVTKEGSVNFPNGKKPESLIQRILDMSTDEKDYVLDSFLGSGTTCAAAHKMNRKWIGIEMGEHANTLCIPRLKSVISGKDSGGISKELDWKGGGGFKFYNLAPSLLKKDKFGNWVIDEKYNPNMLAAAMCKHEGFRYSPDEEVYWKQGKSTENDYIFVTTNYLTLEQLDSIHEEMKSEESLLICAKTFAQECENKYPNITIKKIPQAILGSCEFGTDNYDLNIIEMTEEIAEEQEEEPEDE